jgi:hypothetical protein
MTTLIPPSGSPFIMPTTDLPPAPPESREPEKLGPTESWVRAVTCPACGSVSVLRKTWRVGSPFAWWQCQEDGCGYMWKMPYLAGTGARARVV